MNLCGRESLCDIRRDCCHHFVSEQNFERDAQRVCRAERSLKSPLAGTKRCVRLATNNVINTSNCQLYCPFYTTQLFCKLWSWFNFFRTYQAADYKTSSKNDNSCTKLLYVVTPEKTNSLLMKNNRIIRSLWWPERTHQITYYTGQGGKTLKLLFS